ncbi:hypothetical protein V8F33_006827 [Rhypophila sp. PSN 637]
MGDQQPKVSRYSGYEVHTFQVNVPIGDCSIHLLVTNTPRHVVVEGPPADGPWDLPKHRQTTPLINRADSEKFRRGTVMRAILVDGGQDDEVNYRGYVASKRIRKAILDIESQYWIIHDDNNQIAGTPKRHAVDDNRLIFDAWIVTHWDRDHYCGSLQLIHDDIYGRWHNPQSPTDTLSSYFKYDAHGACHSTLYASSWERPPWKSSPKDRMLAKKNWEKGGKPKGAPFLFPQQPVRVNNILCTQMNVWGARQNCPSPLDYADEDPDSILSDRPLTPPILRLVYEIDDLIGVDFFSGRNLRQGVGVPWAHADWANRTENIASFITKAAEVYGLKPEVPLFLCIGACGSVFGHDARTNNITRPAHCTLENYQSIMAVIAWCGVPDVGIRLSHFMAGDAHNDTEKAMLNFLKLKGQNPDNLGYPIEILKAGHHGSRESTSAELLKACRPKKFIISAGRKHGHPSWQTVLLLVTYYRLQRANATDLDQARWRERPLINTRFPYYMFNSKPGGQQKPVTGEDSTKSIHPDLVAELETDLPISSQMLNLKSYGEEKWAELFRREFPDDFDEQKWKKHAIAQLDVGAQRRYDYLVSRFPTGDITSFETEIKTQRDKKLHSLLNGTDERGYKSVSWLRAKFVNNLTWNMFNSEEVAKFLYDNCSAPMAVEIAFEKFLAVAGNKTNMLKEGNAKWFRAILARLLRYFWDEMSSVGVFNQEFKFEKKALVNKLHYVVLIASREEIYDGRVLQVGPHSAIPGYQVRRLLSEPFFPSQLNKELTFEKIWNTYIWQPSDEKFEVDQRWSQAAVNLSSRPFDASKKGGGLVVARYLFKAIALRKYKTSNNMNDQPADQVAPPATNADLEETLIAAEGTEENPIVLEGDNDEEPDEIHDDSDNDVSVNSMVYLSKDTRLSVEKMKLFLALDLIGLNAAPILFGTNPSINMVRTTGVSDKGPSPPGTPSAEDSPRTHSTPAPPSNKSSLKTDEPQPSSQRQKPTGSVPGGSPGSYASAVGNRQGDDKRAAALQPVATPRRPIASVPTPTQTPLSGATPMPIKPPPPTAGGSRNPSQAPSKPSQPAPPRRTPPPTGSTGRLSPATGKPPRTGVAPPASDPKPRTPTSGHPGKPPATAPPASGNGPKLPLKPTPGAPQEQPISGGAPKSSQPPPTETAEHPSPAQRQELQPSYILAADAVAAQQPLPPTAELAIQVAKAAKKEAKHPVRLVEPGTPGRILVGCMGPLVLLEEEKGAISPPGPFSAVVSEVDATRGYLSSAWCLVGDDKDNVSGSSAFRNMVLQVEEVAPSSVVSASGGVADSTQVGFLRLVNITVQIAKDPSSKPLVFSSRKETINVQFELANPDGGIAPVTTTTASDRANRSVTDLSGIDRFPGSLLLGLESTASSTGSIADGGFKNLGDLLPLVGIRAAGWVKTLLKATDIRFEDVASTPQSTKQPRRNAIWYSPTTTTTCIRLEATVSLSSKIGEFVGKYLKGFESALSTPLFTAVAKRTVLRNGVEMGSDGTVRMTASSGNPDAAALRLQSELTLCLDLDIGNVPRSVGVYVAILEDSITFALVCYSTAVNWTTLKEWLVKNCEGIADAVGRLEGSLGKVSQSTTAPSGSAASTSDNASKDKPQDLSGIYWRRLSASLSREGSVESVSIELEASVGFLVPRGKHAGFSIKFSWQPGLYEFDCEFEGRQVDQAALAVFKQRQRYTVEYERWTNLEPLVPSEPFMSLRYLDRDKPLTDQDIPYGIPTEISEVALSVSNEELFFEGSLQSLFGGPEDEETSQGAKDSKAVPALKLAYVDLNFALGLDYSDKPVKVSGRLEGVIGLEPRYMYDPGFPLQRPAELRALLQYGTIKPGSWSFEASASNIRMTSLYSLFASGSEQDGVMNMLRTIVLNNITLGYTYSGAKASAVKFSADASIGGLRVKTNFLRSSASQWSFGAELAPAHGGGEAGPKKITLLQATSDLLGVEVANLLPDFIQGTELTIDSSSAGKDKLGLVCRRADTPAIKMLAFGAAMSFGLLKVQFGQVSTLAQDDNKKNSQSTAGTKPAVKSKSVVKRVMRVMLGPLPTMQKLPLVDSLELPCDMLEFFWLSADISTDELQAISGVLAECGGSNPNAVAADTGKEGLLKGYYFRLLDKNNKVVISYPFSHQPPKEDTKGPTLAGSKEKAAASVTAPTTAPTTASKSTETASMTPIKKSKGGVSISGIGLTFENKVLSIHLDAKVLVGPVGAGVKGLQVNLDLAKVKGFHDLLDVGVSIDIQGFELSFERSPLVLAGALEHQKTAQSNRFQGGIAISLKAISISALGMYEQVKAAPPVPEYDSFFVYGMVEGTLFTVGWAEVRGIIAAFGYNSRLRLPPVDQIISFPLVSGFNEGGTGGISILGALKTLTGDGGPNAWISPSMGSLWFAAGLVIRACQLLDIRAVATLALGPNQKEIGLLARATACLPRGSTPDKALMLIDLSILGKLDLQHGELAVDGQINPTSFILSRDCRPSGGFAIRTWFNAEEKNPHAGDWVVTFGGYHPLFQRPAHYPAPERLRIGWRVSSNLSVSGEAYAAITPGAVMAGIKMQAVFSLGPIGAYFDAQADFLVNMAPLRYEAVVAVSAGVSYEIRVWRFTKKLSASVGARLELEGPPLGGTVHFKVAFVSFSVDFGPRGQRGSPPALKLREFIDLVLKESSDEGIQAKNPHTLAVVSGRLPSDGQQETGADKKKKNAQPETWLVRAEAFVFQLRSPVPLGTYAVNTSMTAASTTSSVSGPTASKRRDILSRPMQLRQGDRDRALQSQLSLVAHPVNSSSSPVPLHCVSETWDQVSSNLWGEFSTNRDDYLRPEKMAPTVNHLVGLTLRAPLPTLPSDTVTLNKTIEENWTAVPSTGNKLLTRQSSERGGRYTKTDLETRESLQWSRVRGAMLPHTTVAKGGGGGAGGSAPRITREQVLDQLLSLLFSAEKKENVGDDDKTANGEKNYRRIGTIAPRIVASEPQRYYRAPPTVFVS